MINVAFDGEPPVVAAGDLVECRTTSGEWQVFYAYGPARYDRTMALGGKCYLTVPVGAQATLRGTGSAASYINWPAEDVRPVAEHKEDNGG